MSVNPEKAPKHWETTITLPDHYLEPDGQTVREEHRAFADDLMATVKRENDRRHEAGQSALDVILAENDPRFIRSLEELRNATQFAIKRFQGHKPWYRGHAKAKWRLQAFIHRTAIPGQEQNMAINFLLQGPARKKGAPASQNWFDWLTLARHYGLPTRLLDWTESMLTAAFFAVENRESKGDAAIWALDPRALNQVFAGHYCVYAPSAPAVVPCVEGAFRRTDAEEGRKILAVVPQLIDSRLMLQRATFTIHGIDLPLEKIEHAERCLVKFLIPSAFREELYRSLTVIGVKGVNAISS